MSSGPTFLASVLLLFANIVLGGATSLGYLSDVVLQFLSIPFLLLAVWLWIDRLELRRGRAILTFGIVCWAGIVGMGLLIALAQYFAVFGAPGVHGVSVRLLAVGGTAVDVASTGSSSVDPSMSGAALQAVLPALGLFLLVALMDEERRLQFAGWAVVFGFIALFLGILQVMQGPASALRFFEISNRSESVGFFANRNHFAAQLYVTSSSASPGWSAVATVSWGIGARARPR